MLARRVGSCGVNAAAQLQFAGDRRHHRLVAVGADAHFDLPVEIDAVDEFEEAVDKMLARLLAVGDDVDAGILLLLEHEQRGVGLGGGERVAGELPFGPELVRLGEP